MVVTIAINVIAFNVFENEIRLPSLRNAGIDQLRDIRMRHPSQNRTFPLESLLASLPHQREVDQLDGNAAFKSPVSPLRKPDCARSALPDLRDQRVNADRLTCQAR